VYTPSVEEERAIREGLAQLDRGEALCQRRSKNASAGRSKNTSAMLARRPPNWAFSLGVKPGWDYPPRYRDWQGVSVACFD
jgi:hypothetical protein